jgi:hypothetical protein
VSQRGAGPRDDDVLDDALRDDGLGAAWLLTRTAYPIVDAKVAHAIELW